jgi:hypothetical protein
LALQCGAHGGGCVHPLVDDVIAAALQLAHQQRGVLFRIFDDEYSQRHLGYISRHGKFTASRAKRKLDLSPF